MALAAYRDAGGVWTIGYGHTGPDVLPGMQITTDQADDLLTADLEGSENAVSRLIFVPLNDNQFAALVAFTFNVGAGALEHSSLRRILNGDDYGAVPVELARWNREGGCVMAGLIARRAAEIELWRTPETIPADGPSLTS